MRSFDVSGNGKELSAPYSEFYIVVNESSEIVDYNYLAFPLHYDSYAAWRVPVGTKLHVPVEIVKFLHAHGNKTKMGPANSAPESGAVIVR